MNSSDREVHLAIAFDQNYLSQFYALLESLIRNNQNIRLYFHTIATGVDEDQQFLIKKYITETHNRINFYSIDQSVVSKLKLANNWTQAVYYRLFFPLLVPTEVVTLLYLDVDTLVTGNIAELYNEDIGEYPVAAVYDSYVKRQPLIGIDNEDEYFNSGVLLINVNRWKEETISERVMEYLQKFPERILYVDQCGLNAVLKKKWKHLNSRFNLIYSYIPTPATRKQLQQLVAKTVIVHFTLERPWNFLCKNRLRFLYKKYLRLSPLAKKQVHVIDDFSLSKIPAWVKIRMTEFYFDSTLLQGFWKSFKKIF